MNSAATSTGTHQATQDRLQEPAALDDLLHRLKEGINPVWADIRGTESYDNRQAVEAIESLLADLEVATEALSVRQAELDKTRAALTEVRRDLWDTGELNGSLSAILAKTADALRGPPDPLSLHSWHDLPERAGALRRIAELAAAAVSDPGWGAFSGEDDALLDALEAAGLIPGPPLQAQD